MNVLASLSMVFALLREPWMPNPCGGGEEIFKKRINGSSAAWLTPFHSSIYTVSRIARAVIHRGQINSPPSRKFVQYRISLPRNQNRRTMMAHHVYDARASGADDLESAQRAGTTHPWSMRDICNFLTLRSGIVLLRPNIDLHLS